MAIADPCDLKKYQTDIHILEPKLTIPLKHKHQTHHYCSENKWYHWKGHEELGHKELVKDETNDIVATFHPSPFEGNIETLVGKVSISQQEMQDIAVITELVLQEREEEFKSPVPPILTKTLIVVGNVWTTYC